MGIQQGASACVIPPVIVGREDLKADHPGPGPLGRILPSDDADVPW